MVQFAVHFDPDRTAAVSAFGMNLTGEKGAPESPLHEGRRNRVCGSGGVYFLARMEFDSMGSVIHRNRICPNHFPLRIPE